MFAWLRNRVCDAFIAGVQDGIDAVTTAPASGTLNLPAPRLLRLPAPDDYDDDSAQTDGTASTTKRKKSS